MMLGNGLIRIKDWTDDGCGAFRQRGFALQFTVLVREAKRGQVRSGLEISVFCLSGI